jgi:hypothetical protein
MRDVFDGTSDVDLGEDVDGLHDVRVLRSSWSRANCQPPAPGEPAGMPTWARRR